MVKEGYFVGLIPDGNRSWEREQVGREHLSYTDLLNAYDQGAQAVKRIIEWVRDDERIGIFVPWGLSVDNFDKRDVVQKEVLFRTFERFLRELRDEWMDKPENKDVRFVHMGRLVRLTESAPEVAELLAELTHHTRNRTGMVLAVALDYNGLDEGTRAHHLWAVNGYDGDYVSGWKYHLDLPRQIPELRVLDDDKNLTTHAHLILRTKTAEATIPHDNEFLHPYLKETRHDLIDVYLPALTPELFAQKFEAFLSETMKKGA